MKYTLILVIILKSFYLSAQNDSIIFDNSFKFKNGIYTSNSEVLKNEPKYPDNILEVKVDELFGSRTFYYYKGTQNKKLFKDSVFAFVYENNMAVNYKGVFYRLFLKGTISTFFTETIHTYSTGYSETKDKLYFVDLKTGMIEKLNPLNIDDVIKRDSLLYSTFSALSDSKKRKTLYSYILKYNMRNPIYLKVD